jgi:hypothetical protein
MLDMKQTLNIWPLSAPTVTHCLSACLSFNWAWSLELGVHGDPEQELYSADLRSSHTS